VVATQDAALINDFKVYVGDDHRARVFGGWRRVYNYNSNCGESERYAAIQGPNVIQCGRRIQGRYVFVYVERSTTIALHEVEVYTNRMTE
jgi:hypothetical protein